MMNAKYAVYEKYKESGIAWLGRIPIHWQVSRLKWRYQITLGKMLKSKQTAPDETEAPYLRAANIQWRGVDTTDVKRMWFSPEEKKKLQLCKGDLLVSEGGDVGRSALWNEEIEGCYIQNSINRIRARENADTRFLYYWMYFIKHAGYIDMICNKATIAHFTVEKVGATPCVYPPLEEQKQIIAYLDRETAKMDALVEKQEQLITLLREKRQAIISYAVTRGLNPNVKMKDSGIEWLGEVPAHWEVQKIKYVAHINPSKSELKTIPLDTPVTFLPMESIGETGRLDTRNSKPLSEVVSAGYTYLAENDVIIAKITPCFENGKGAIATGLLNGIAFATTEVVPFRCFRINNQYLYFLLSSSPFRKIAEGSMYGAGGQKRVSETFFANYKCCIPPTNEEQKQIAVFLNEETTKIDALVEKCETAIALLKERRTALIAAAVTGKIDVRKAI